MSKARLMYLLVFACLLAYMLAVVLRPTGLSDGGGLAAA
jgi:hypothetical protein